MREKRRLTDMVALFNPLELYCLKLIRTFPNIFTTIDKTHMKLTFGKRKINVTQFNKIGTVQELTWKNYKLDKKITN